MYIYTYLHIVAEELVDIALNRVNLENITVMVVGFPSAIISKQGTGVLQLRKDRDIMFLNQSCKKKNAPPPDGPSDKIEDGDSRDRVCGVDDARSISTVAANVIDPSTLAIDIGLARRYW